METGRRLDILKALNGAATVLHQSFMSCDDVLQAAVTQIEKLGLRGGILLLDDDRTRICVTAMAHPAKFITALEKLTGLSVVGHSLDYRRIDVYRKVIDDRCSVFTPNSSDIIAQSIPQAARSFVSQILNYFGGTPSIHAPMMIAGKIIGSLDVAGKGLSVEDVPIIEAFTNYITVALCNARLLARVMSLGEDFRLSNQDLNLANGHLQQEIVERKRLEGLLSGAQKMESVGRSAGGIAHDFNNKLTLILGCADMILAKTADGDIGREEASEIRKAVQEAANISRQLLG